MTPSSSAPVDAVLSAPVECAGADGVAAAWQIGAAVFCPGRGLGLVVERAASAPLGTPREYLTILIERVGMTIRVPVDRAAELGLRPPASPEELGAALEVLSSTPSDGGETWQARIKINRVKLGDGSIEGAAEVLRDLAWRATRRPLGMQERDQHVQALELLEGQIMYVMELDAADARALLAERLPVQEPAGG